MIGRREPPSAREEEKPKGFDDFDFRLGDLMRGERATLGKSLLDVQRELKIKASYIAAIENCDVAAFETPGFIAGYVRSYARYLGMEPDWAFRKFCDEAGFVTAHGMSSAASSPKPLAVRRPRKTDYADPLANPNAVFVPKAEAFFSGVQPGAIGSLAVLLVLIAGLGYGGWTVLQEVQRVSLAPVDQAPGVAADLDPLSEALRVANMSEPDTLDTSPISGGPQREVDGALRADSFDRIYRPQALEVPVMVARDGPIAAIDPRTFGALVSEMPDAIALALESALEAEPQVQVVADVVPEVEIFAVRPSWVRVRASDGTVLFEKILDAGERYVVPQTEEPATLRAGNSGSLYFAVNGKAYGPAAPGAQVVSNVPLSATELSARYTVADLDSDPELARIIAVAEARDD